MDDTEFDIQIKTIIIGDSGCGKTCVLQKLKDKDFDFTDEY